MNGHALEELYLTWLYRQIADVEETRPSRTFWKLCSVLQKKEFTWTVPNDDNRVEDGRSLRYEFVEDLGLDDVDPAWLQFGCSMLEMLVGLSRRLSFQAEGEPHDWFWHLLGNIGLKSFNDRVRFPLDHVEEVLDVLIHRRYNRNGTGGGLFPLRRPTRDQRSVEIWYQLSAYLQEHG